MQEGSDDHGLQQSALISGNPDHHLVLAGCELETGKLEVCGLKLKG